MANTQSTAQAGALTLVLLVRKYRSQMISLLVKNGIVVDNNASDEQITTLMVNLLKVSKSYFKDLNDFITNPAVAQAVAGGIQENAQYYKAEGDDLMAELEALANQQDPVTESAKVNTNSNSTTSGGSSSWWTGIKSNLGNYLSDGIKLIGTLSTNKANAEIAKAHATVATAESGSNTTTNPPANDKKSTNTTTVVVLSIVGVAVIGAIIYFVTRPKK